MPHDPCCSSRGNWQLHEGDSVSGSKAGVDTADSDVARPFRSSAMPAAGVLHFLPKSSSHSVQCFTSVVATDQGRR